MSGSGDNASESANVDSTGGTADVRGHDAGSKRGPGRSTKVLERYRHTRTSAAWAAIVVAILFGVALIDFIAQNTSDVRIEFFSVSGRMPIAVALLAAALAGAVVVVAVGVGRVFQLRMNLRRQRRRTTAQNGADVALGTDDPADDNEDSTGHE